MRLMFATMLTAGLVFAETVSALDRTPAPAGVELYFIDLKDGQTVDRDFVVRFGLSGMGVAPAGIKLDKTGHHHLLINADLPEDLSQPLPNDAQHRHYGGGQTEAKISLEPGEHTLQLVLGDFLHVPFDPVIASAKITVVVK